MQITERNASIGYPLQRWLHRRTAGTAILDIPELYACIGTTIGEVRPENQDRALVARWTNPASFEHSFVSCIVCDGMGGMAEGSRCAEIGIATFLESLIEAPPSSSESIRIAAISANKAIYDAYRGRGGTTLAAVVLWPHGRTWGVTVGDSRLYTFSSPGQLKQLSTDDTIAGELQRLRGSDPTSSASQLDDFSNRLAQYVGIGDGLEPRIYKLDSLPTESTHLLSTDGIQIIPATVIEEIFSAAPSPFVGLTRIVHLSRWCGGRDNASAVCVQTSKVAPLLSLHSQTAEATLEAWDSFGKLEIPLGTNFRTGLHRPQQRQVDTPRASPIQQQPIRTSRDQQDTAKRSKPKKQRQPGSKVRNSQPPGPGPQRELEIQIVETASKPDNGDQKQNSEPKSTPDQADKNSSNTSSGGASRSK